MAKPRYNSAEDYVKAIETELMSRRSLSQLKQYYKKKGNEGRVNMITRAFEILNPTVESEEI